MPRYSRSYLKSYNFSGMTSVATEDLPARIEKLLEFSKTINPDLNQSLFNWYEIDGSIGKHSDNKTQLKENSDIFSFSFGPAKRFFILRPISKEDQRVNILLDHNTLLIMGGRCQYTHTHEVPKYILNEKNVTKDEENNNRRLNVTFRCFK